MILCRWYVALLLVWLTLRVKVDPCKYSISFLSTVGEYSFKSFCFIIYGLTLKDDYPAITRRNMFTMFFTIKR